MIEMKMVDGIDQYICTVGLSQLRTDGAAAAAVGAAAHTAPFLLTPLEKAPPLSIVLIPPDRQLYFLRRLRNQKRLRFFPFLHVLRDSMLLFYVSVCLSIDEAPVTYECWSCFLSFFRSFMPPYLQLSSHYLKRKHKNIKQVKREYCESLCSC